LGQHFVPTTWWWYGYWWRTYCTVYVY